MKYVSAYLLCAVTTAPERPLRTAVETVLRSIGIQVDSNQLNTVMHEMERADLRDLLTTGMLPVCDGLFYASGKK